MGYFFECDTCGSVEPVSIGRDAFKYHFLCDDCGLAGCRDCLEGIGLQLLCVSCAPSEKDDPECDG